MTSSKLQHPAVDATVAVTLLALGASCERQTTTSTGPNTTTTASTVTPAPRIETAIDKAGDTLADPVTARVEAALLADSAVKGLDIDVDTRSGVVSLSGARQRRERRARRDHGQGRGRREVSDQPAYRQTFLRPGD